MSGEIKSHVAYSHANQCYSARFYPFARYDEAVAFATQITNEPVTTGREETFRDPPQHASDCAVHNEPALPAGPCDCEASYVASIYARAEAEREKAQRKFPQPNFVALKVAEEAGEVIKAAVHYSEDRGSWTEVEKEAVQAIAMIMRLLVEGDQKNGIIPPTRD